MATEPPMAKRRAMTSENASQVKKKGHAREQVFAELIGGVVLKGTKKADVQKGEHLYSVKSGEWAQIFLYRKTNTALLGPEFRACLNIFPDKRSDYLNNKVGYKTALQEPMRQLKAHLDEKGHLEQFLRKAMFDTIVHFLVIARPGAFLEFQADDVCRVLTQAISVENSKARSAAQMDDQKVVFRLEGVNKTLGEIEVRHDSDVHYNELKCRFNVPTLCSFLETRCAVNKHLV
jgi:hypothetical protein